MNNQNLSNENSSIEAKKEGMNQIPLSEYPINIDSDPEIQIKSNSNVLKYIQQISVRYLKPPTPEPSGEIIINELVDSVPPAPPIIIREHPKRIKTPEPLVIREKPPPLPSPPQRQIITIPGKHLPPPPRKVIIERLPNIPNKPQPIIVERWLAYPKLKRQVLFNQNSQNTSNEQKLRNLIIQWDSPKLIVKKKFNYLGIIKTNPKDYVEKYGQNLKSPSKLPNFVHQIETPENVTLAADCKPKIELYGDVEALKLIDLDKENLNEYKDLVESLAQDRNSSVEKVKKNDKNLSEILTLIKKLYRTLKKYENGTVKIKDTKRLIENFNQHIDHSNNDVFKDKQDESLISKEEFIKIFLSFVFI